MLAQFEVAVRALYTQLFPNFGPRWAYPTPLPSDMWHFVNEKIEPYRTADRSHINFAIDGEIVPFASIRPREYRLPRSYFFDVKGGPKGGKSHLLRRMSDMLENKRIPFVTWLESKPLSMNVLNNPPDKTIQKTLLLSSGLLVWQSAFAHGGETSRQKNFYIFENGVFGLWTFARMHEVLTNQSDARQYVEAVTRRYYPMHYAVATVDIPWEVAKRRGTKMPKHIFEAYKTAEEEFPAFIAKESKSIDHPIALIHIDARARSPREQAMFTLGSLANTITIYKHD